MSQYPVSDEIGTALGKFFFGGSGPSHSTLTNVFVASGYGQDDAYDPKTKVPNKETRVRSVVKAAVRRPQHARELVDGLLVQLRAHGCFDVETENYDAEAVRVAQRAFRQSGWLLDDHGSLTIEGPIDLSTGGRTALDEQLERLRRSTDDPGQLLGTAKDLLEAVAKFVLEELEVPLPNTSSFDYLWHLARDRLGILPQQVNVDLPGSKQIRAILQSSWTIAEQTNELRGLQGAGHGRTLPTGVSTELALLVVREACSVAEYVLAQLDRSRGR
ncbi:abortive infection family protein [Ferrimicrobium sp.]|uniref:abortive infection family protein n=1 Tax=Ferrimicrobium sp. TaxID=2926050 RepID=UPI00262310F1|nr:abortive infection family protein [Ferrimicrobium sp.]